MLAQRETTVLEAVIRDYIAQAAPVSSKRVLEISSSDLSPASIRSILVNLEESGYISQPHTSAGRIPTQKGYRFFVDNLMECPQGLPARTTQRIQAAHTLRQAVKVIAEETHLCAIVALPGYNLSANLCLTELFREPEFQDAAFIAKFGRLIDAVLEKHTAYTQAIRNTGFGVFIEKENVIPEARCASVMVASFPEHNGFLLALGPMRMDYERVAGILQVSAQVLEHTRP